MQLPAAHVKGAVLLIDPNPTPLPDTSSHTNTAVVLVWYCALTKNMEPLTARAIPPVPRVRSFVLTGVFATATGNVNIGLLPIDGEVPNLTDKE
jgi:hypothetical protein